MAAQWIEFRKRSRDKTNTDKLFNQEFLMLQEYMNGRPPK